MANSRLTQGTAMTSQTEKADNAKPLPEEDSTANITDRATRFWEKYAKEAEDHDDDFIQKNGDNIEGVMLFAGLFSAVAAAFLVVMQPDLQPDATATTNALLMMLVHANNNSVFSDQDIGIPVWNGPSTAVVWSQALGYAALSSSLLSALGAVLGKQWLNDFARLRCGTLEERSRRRQEKLDSLKTWQFEMFMGSLPALIQLALLLFGITLAIHLWELNHVVGSILIAATAIGVLFYLFITIASLLFPACPYQTPVSSTIHAAIGHAMKSVEEVAEYWAWRTNKHIEKRPRVSRGNKILAWITAVLFSPFLAVGVMTLLIAFATFAPLYMFIDCVRGRGDFLRTKVDSYRSAFQLRTLRRRFHALVSWVHDSARRARNFMKKVYLDPEPDSSKADPRAIAWILETSTDPDNLMAAAELVPDVKWPEDLDTSLPAEHLCSIFIRSIPERTFNDRALCLGKAFIIMLCQLSKEVSVNVWKAALHQVVQETRILNADVDCDLLFILTIVNKLLSHKLGSADNGVECPAATVVSESLLAWFLQPLETLLLLDHPHQSRFLPEAYRAFLKLNSPDESRSEVTQEIQYFRTFEIYFNSVVGCVDVEEMNRIVEQNSQDSSKLLNCDRLRRILEKLKHVDLSRLPDAHQHFIVPLAVLSRLACLSYMRETFNEIAINPWIITAFKVAVDDANRNGESMWLFASSLMKLAIAIDAFNPIITQVDHTSRAGDGNPRTPVPLLSMDSKSLLAFLLNKETPATPEQAIYALQIMLTNVHEHHDLASNPDFVNYILYATAPGQVYSIRDIGLKVLVATCQYLIRTFDTQSLASLEARCDLVRFIRRAILNQDPPNILKDLLHNDDKDFNADLLRILSPALGDPFSTLLSKLREEPNKVPECDLRDLEIALVLSNEEGRKRLLYDHLDSCIALMPLRDYKYGMALPFTIIVGWLLRHDGPLSTSEAVWKTLLRPNFEELLFSAWADPDVLEDNPQLLRLLLDCTAKWLSTVDKVSPSSLTLTRLDHALDQLKNSGRALSSDIKRSLQKLSRDIGRFMKE